MKISKRIISLILVISITIPVFVITPVSAASNDSWGASGSGLITDTNSVVAWSAWMDANIIAFADQVKPLFWNVIDKSLSSVGLGRCFSSLGLKQTGWKWNTYISSDAMWKEKIAYCFPVWTNVLPSVVYDYDSSLGVYRLREKTTNLWLVNSSGHFPYYAPETPDQEVSYGYQWRTTGQSTWNAGLAIVSYTELKEILALGYDGYIERRGNYLHIFDRSTDGTQILCSEEGFPLAAIADLSSTAVDTPNNYFPDGDKGDPVYNQFVDITNNTTWFPDGTLQYIDKVVYDESTKTYIVDSHDSYTYKSTTNTYVTNNYRYEYNYHIDYTSVTYIGTTEQYDEEYRYYYQLPDGRSSADLTAEDLEQLSIAFVDVVNYARSADDANMRVLYHFDGNTQDSSYWSYCTDFTWNSGASLTYMDEGTFGGSLYLDETEHDFTITLPNTLDGAYDYTLQFRYYQSYTAAPVTDSYIKLGDNHVLWFSGSEYKIGSFGGTSIAQTSIGTWNEIALICSGGTLHYYFNGVPYTTSADGYFTGGTITFHFGSEQQTYKKLDELRFSRGAIYTPGENYEPTAVPHDTNLTLILPDGERPLADEVMVIIPSENNLLDPVGLSDWSSKDVVSNLYGSSSLLLDSDPSSVIPDVGLPSIGYNSRKFNFAQKSGSVLVNFGGTTLYTSVSSLCDCPVNCLVLPIRHSYYKQGPVDDMQYGYKSGVSYTLSVVLSDGSYSYVTFHPLDSMNPALINALVIDSVVELSDIKFSSHVLGFRVGSGDSTTNATENCILIYSETGKAEIAYMELVEGTEPQFEITYEMAMYSSGELEDSPVLAVRSNQTITGYQIGGVRPSYPEKGQVWAMVENGRITSLQQYSGSAWIEVDGRIWTGERWIPYSSFDVFLLKDCYDIQGTVTGDDYEYIYSEFGFWAWWQKQWLGFKDGLFGKLDAIIAALEELTGLEISDEAGCQHVYTTEVYDPTCSDPGHTLYTCTECGYGFTEPIDALGHDWIVEEDVPNVYEMPDGAHCPGCSGTDFTFVINANQDKYTCTCTVCSVEWSETPEVTYGYTLSTCSRCGKTQKDSKDPESGLFDALGNFLADGVEWVTDKLTQAVNGLSEMLSLFRDYAESMKDKVGQYPAFLAAVLTVFPQDLMDVFWFGLIAVVVVFVWKKVFS